MKPMHLSLLVAASLCVAACGSLGNPQLAGGPASFDAATMAAQGLDADAALTDEDLVDASIDELAGPNYSLLAFDALAKGGRATSPHKQPGQFREVGRLHQTPDGWVLVAMRTHHRHCSPQGTPVSTASDAPAPAPSDAPNTMGALAKRTGHASATREFHLVGSGAALGAIAGLNKHLVLVKGTLSADTITVTSIVEAHRSRKPRRCSPHANPSAQPDPNNVDPSDDPSAAPAPAGSTAPVAPSAPGAPGTNRRHRGPSV